MNSPKIYQTLLTFLLAFLLLGCGLMGSSKGNEENQDNATSMPTAMTDDTSTEASNELFTIPMPKNSKNEMFLDELGYFNQTSSPTYKIFDNNQSQNDFLNDLNNRAQMLDANDSGIVNTWIQNVQLAAVDFNQSNLLFLPILTPTSCTLSTTIETIENHAFINIQKELLDCNVSSPMYHALFYSIGKNIEQINVSVFEHNSTLANNQWL